jgi:hypothetical protein
MKHLQQYIEQKNSWRRVFKQEELSITGLTQRDADHLFRILGVDLSPENLSCDGELRGRALQAKATMLNGAVRELERMGFTAPADAYF